MKNFHKMKSFIELKQLEVVKATLTKEFHTQNIWNNSSFPHFNKFLIVFRTLKIDNYNP